MRDMFSSLAWRSTDMLGAILCAGFMYMALVALT